MATWRLWFWQSAMKTGLFGKSISILDRKSSFYEQHLLKSLTRLGFIFGLSMCLQAQNVVHSIHCQRAVHDEERTAQLHAALSGRTGWNTYTMMSK